jgi:hypothetical protein
VVANHEIQRNLSMRLVECSDVDCALAAAVTVFGLGASLALRGVRSCLTRVLTLLEMRCWRTCQLSRPFLTHYSNSYLVTVLLCYATVRTQQDVAWLCSVQHLPASRHVVLVGVFMHTCMFSVCYRIQYGMVVLAWVKT